MNGLCSRKSLLCVSSNSSFLRVEGPSSKQRPVVLGSGELHPNHPETSRTPRCLSLDVFVNGPQHWGPECPPIEDLETKVCRWLRMCGPSVSNRQPRVRFFPKNEGTSVFGLRLRVPCCRGSPPWPVCPPSRGGGFGEGSGQRGVYTGGPGVVAPGGTSGNWGSGPLPSSVMSPWSDAWSFRADGWSESPGALCPAQGWAASFQSCRVTWPPVAGEERANQVCGCGQHLLPFSVRLSWFLPTWGWGCLLELFHFKGAQVFLLLCPGSRSTSQESKCTWL